jgi:tetratricopeptide (TPR) repeat protein
LERALREHPTHPDSAIWMMILHIQKEEYEEGTALAQAARLQQPTNGALKMFLGDIQRLQGNPDTAIAELRTVLDVTPDNISAVRGLVIAYLDAGDLTSARALLEEKRTKFQDNFLWRHSWALLLAAEHRPEARDAMDEVTLKYSQTSFVITAETADYWALLGDKDKAVEWLELAYRNGDERIGYFQRNPRLASIQSEPRFQQLVQSIKASRTR